MVERTLEVHVTCPKCEEEFDTKTTVNIEPERETVYQHILRKRLKT